jgi:hypothetical protein
MDDNPLPEIAAIETLLTEADLPQDARQTALWCVRQLPGLYRDLARTYDSRHGDEILRLSRAASLKVSDLRVAEAIRGQLVGLHERLGFGALDLKPRRPPARRSRKAG